MTKLLVLYYSMYGHIEIMAKAVAEGVRSCECRCGDEARSRYDDARSGQAIRGEA